MNGKELELQCDVREVLDGLAMQTDHDLRRSIGAVLSSMGFKPKQLKSVQRVVLRVLDHSEDRLSREAARLFVLFADHVRPRLKSMTDSELFSAAVLLSELIALSIDSEPIPEERLGREAIEEEGPPMRKEFAAQLSQVNFERDYSPENISEQHDRTVEQARVLWDEHLRDDRSHLPERFQELRDTWNREEEQLREKLAAAQRRIQDLEGFLVSENARFTGIIEDLMHRLAVETEMGNRFLSYLPWSKAVLVMPMKRLGEQLDEEHRRQVSNVLAASLSLYGVAGSDLDVAEEGGGILRVTIAIRKPGSVCGAVQALKASLNGTVSDGVVPVLSNIGTPKKAVVIPEFPLQRMRVALEMRFRTKLPQVYYERMVDILSQAGSRFEVAWAVHREAEPTQADALVELASQLRIAQVVPEHPHVSEETLETSRRAHQRLKEQLAPGTPWAETPPARFEDLKEWRPTNRLRSWTAPEEHPLRAEHYDPGVGNRIFSRMGVGSPGKPRVLSRFCLVFESAAELTAGLEHLRAKFDVVWVENRFGSPSCIGERDINVGIRQFLEGEPPITVLSELTLLLRGCWSLLEDDFLFDALHVWGVKNEHLVDARQLVLRLADATDFRARNEPEVGGNFLVRKGWAEAGPLLEKAPPGSTTYAVLDDWTPI